MAYVQCSLLHIPALIVHGDTLRAETYSVWRTFAHVMVSGMPSSTGILGDFPRHHPNPHRNAPYNRSNPCHQ